MKVITEATLRNERAGSNDRKVRVAADSYLTQTAKDYIREQNLEIVFEDSAPCDMEKPSSTESEGFTDEEGNHYHAKPEHMTHLRGHRLVSKSHPVISFRGKMDSLQAKILEAQIIAHRDNQADIVRDLEQILDYTRRILAAEVNDAQFEPPQLLGYGDETLRAVSHNPQGHFGVKHLMPSYRMGEAVVALNTLRTYARETELAAIRAFPDEDSQNARPDIIRALNRLSSAIYIVMCRVLSENYLYRRK